MCNAVIRFFEVKMCCRQGQTTRRKWFKAVKL